ncbi:MAG TPA: AarF/ABC1/UbiB kinase family protein [Phycisphaerales bacterium]|nr:AarF/ABC1/UbiB kinase family protein [Phycisphaerales bacterium]
MARRIPNLRRTIRNIKRGQEIVAVMVNYGFTDIVQELALDRLILHGKRLVGLDKPGEEIIRQPQAVRLRQAMENLGPTFIKMAQILSTRPDLIPESWAHEFAKLQSGVPPVPAEAIRPYIESIYDGRLGDHFESVDFDAFAAASIAQAHNAVLKDGTRVILKVLRPGVRRTLEADIEILRALAEIAEARFADMGYSPVQIVEQFERQVLRELDLALEQRSIRRMADLFADNRKMCFPRTYPEHSGKQILCLEKIDGVLLSDAEDGTFTHEERREIVAIGSDAVFRQCFDFGFFHADPHPGNIFVIRDEPADENAPGIRLCFIDYGMTGHIDPHTAELLADLVHGTINGDLARVIAAVVELTDMPPIASADRGFRADVWEFISRFQTESLAQLEMGSLLNEFFAKLRRHKLRCPADIVYLIKAVTTIEGVGEQVCPDFDLVSHVRPHIEKLVKSRYGFRAIRRRLQTTSLGYAELLESLPGELQTISKMVRHEQLIVQLKHQGLDDVTSEIERASRNISLALISSALLVCGSIFFLADAAAGGSPGLLFAGGVIAMATAVCIALYWLVTRSWN